MKKSLFFIPAALMAFASCSNEDFDVNNGNGYQGETETRYISVNIVDNFSGTRAADATYENGTEAENEVTYVRFYLFGPQGGKFINTHVDCTAETITNTGAPNVEKMLHSVIVFEAPKGDPEPIQIVAVVNPPTGTEALADSYPTPEELQTKVSQYDATDKGKFILTNSVFLDDKGEEHVGYQIDQSYPSRDEALLAPTEIYVERVVAKARVKVEGITKTGDYYNIKSSKEGSDANTMVIKVYNPETEQLEDTKVYLNLLGWNVTGTAKDTRLVKKVEKNWKDITGLTSWGWNDTPYNRSYWAENTPALQSLTSDFNNYKEALNFGTFTTGEAAADYIKNFSGDNDKVNYTYLLENAGNTDGSSAAYATKLIVAAQLVDENGDGLDLAWWKGNYYGKADLLQVLATESRVYSKKNEDGASYEPISVAQLRYETATNVDGDAAKRRYFSYARVNGTLSTENQTWYVKDGTGQYNAISASDVTAYVNGILKGLDVVKVWSDGYTYYWTDITHFGSKPDADSKNYGYTGIVRNHIYDFELSAFVGLGIPVLNPGDPTSPDDPDNPNPDPDPENPDDTIYPEDPDDPEYAFIAARINILSWRFVGHPNTQLGWE